MAFSTYTDASYVPRKVIDWRQNLGLLSRLLYLVAQWLGHFGQSLANWTKSLLKPGFTFHLIITAWSFCFKGWKNTMYVLKGSLNMFFQWFGYENVLPMVWICYQRMHLSNEEMINAVWAKLKFFVQAALGGAMMNTHQMLIQWRLCHIRWHGFSSVLHSNGTSNLTLPLNESGGSLRAASSQDIHSGSQCCDIHHSIFHQ